MRCTFCNVPYEDRYEMKPVDPMIEALHLAFSDPLQPAQHVLVSGGTPAPRDVAFLRDVYERVLAAFPDRHVDIMMVPIDGLFDLPRLKAQGLHELSINLELHDTTVSKRLMPQKHVQGAAFYLRFIREATRVFGERRVRSMLMVGLEPTGDTLAGVTAILEAGGVPVLSPFRPDPKTPLAGRPAPSADTLEEVFSRATELADTCGATLGPSCPPCTHNTLTLVPADRGAELYRHRPPVLV
jgi:hypothetical protein